MFAFLDRASVYIFGALLTFFLAKVMEKSDFGRYALYQSIIEFCCVLGTLGVGPLFSEIVSKSRSIPVYKKIFFISLQGSFFASIAFFVLSYVFLKLQFSIEYKIALIAVFSIFIFTCNQLEFSWNRYFDGARLLNRDAAIRSLFVLVFSSLLFFNNSKISFILVVFLNLLSYFLTGVFNFSLRRRLSTSVTIGQFVFDNRVYTAWVHAVSAFLLKKADIFVVGYFFSFSEIAVFKIAFLLMEVQS